jgi:hypothetical protein
MNEVIKKNGIKFGVITGAISVLMSLTFYLIDIKLFINPWLGFGLILLYLAIGIYQLIELKRDLSGKMPFKEAFTGYFYAAFIGISISTLFSILLFNVIDTEARDLITENLITYQAEQFQKWNVPTEQIKESIKQMKENPQFTIGGLTKGYGFSLLGAAIFGLILAAIMKSKTNPLNE